MSKPGKSLKELCKKLGVRLTVKRGNKRVYKSVKVLKEQCKRKKKKKVKRRRRKFGTGTPERGRPDSETPRTVRGNPNAITPGYWNSPPGWLRGSPSSFSPIPYVNTNSDSDSDEEETDFILQGPPSVRVNLGPRRLDFTDEADERPPVNGRLFQYSKKNKKRRKFGSLPITPPTVKKKDRRNFNNQLQVIQYPVLNSYNIDPNLMDSIEQITNDETLYDDFWEPSTNVNRQLLQYGKKKNKVKRKKVKKRRKVSNKKKKSKK